MIALALRCLRFQRVQLLLAKSSQKRRDSLHSETRDTLQEFIEETRLSIHYAARFYGGCFTCLPQSLSLWWLLRRRGLEPDFRLGVRHSKDEFQAHAWVEYEGQNLEIAALCDVPFTPFEKAILPEALQKTNSPQ
jgi:hypothetical protein